MKQLNLSRLSRLALPLGLVALGFGIRAYRLGYQSLWLDELFSVIVARRPWDAVLVGTIQGDTNPPLFNLLLHLVLTLGRGDSWARSLSLFFSTATLPLVYGFARRLWDRRAALITLGLLAVSPFHLLFAQEARMYAQLGFFWAVALLAFQRAWWADSRPAWLTFTLATAATFYTHSLAFLNLLALDGFVLTERSHWRDRWRGWLLAHVGVGLLFVPWLGVMLDQARRVQSGFWAGHPSPLELITTLCLFFCGSTLPAAAVPLALTVLLTLLAFGLLSAWHHLRARSEHARGLSFVLALTFIPPLTLYALSWLRPIFVPRTLLPASLAAYVFLGWTLAHARPRRLLLPLGGLLVGLMVVALGYDYFNPAVQKPALRQAAQVAEELASPDEPILHTSDASALAFMVYAPQLDNVYLAGDPDYTHETTRRRSGLVCGLHPLPATEAVADHETFWVVVALEHNVSYQQAQVAWLDAHYRRLTRQDVLGISLLHYAVGP